MLFAFLLALAAPLLEWRAEFTRPDPFGGTVAVDRAASSTLAKTKAHKGGYVSAHLVVRLAEPGAYRLTVSAPADSGLQVDAFREWLHSYKGAYYPDALIPVALPVNRNLPDPDNKIEKQTAQPYWIDVWVPASAQPGPVTVTATVEAGGQKATAAWTLDISSKTIPAEDTLSIDHNSYGTSWFAGDYPNLARKHGARWTTSDDFFHLIHAYHRVFYEHRGIFHQLGYGHGGKVAPEFAPQLEGSGRTRKIANWNLYDRHYGPLFDGSAFAKTRRGARPIPYVYLPINPEWPAQFVNWGEPGYETEFVNVVSAMERHFREKGWTRTTFELFFNHKKRYKAFPWDGDEVRFLEDDAYFKTYWDLWNKAWPKSSPVKARFRSDSSWSIEPQMKDLAGIVTMWVCGSGTLSMAPDSARQAKARGDVVWHYSGPPSLDDHAAAISRHMLRAWVWNIDGYIHWLTTSAGSDPWFHSDGGGTALVYPGERFGVEEPIPSVRLKIQRNVLQDIALLERAQAAAVTRAYNDSKPDDWWFSKPPEAANRAANTITNADIEDWEKPGAQLLQRAGAASWQKVRELIQ